MHTSAASRSPEHGITAEEISEALDEIDAHARSGADVAPYAFQFHICIAPRAHLDPAIRRASAANT